MSVFIPNVGERPQMLKVTIPGFEVLNLEYLVLDYNGTVAVDGVLRSGVSEKMAAIAKFMQIYVITADTFGTAQEELRNHSVMLKILSSEDHMAEKCAFVESIGAEAVAAVGNGNNDAAMLKAAKVGVAVTGGEGCSVLAARSADILCSSIDRALELFVNPDRLKATLRR
jgi:P-type E1-E2 ATPase